MKLSVLQAWERMHTGQGSLVDVRTEAEWRACRVPGAVRLAVQRDVSLPEQSMLICATGRRAEEALEIWADADVVEGGIEAWSAAGLPLLRSDDRYLRHRLLPEVGDRGQERLAQARVLCVGAGGLGSPALLYLAAAGIGGIGIVDDDVVDASNLQRQVLYAEADVGLPKAERAAGRVLALNSGIDAHAFRLRLDASNVDEVIEDWDMVLDGVDNLASRVVLHEACRRLRVPVVHGSVDRFEGMISVFDYRDADAPCYRCFFPAADDQRLATSCDAAGVLGVLPGVIGTLMATETLKLLLEVGECLTGRLAVFDALSMNLTTFRGGKLGDCPLCSEVAGRCRID